MSFVTAFMAVTTAFVLLAPLAMVVVLVAGAIPVRRAPAPADSERAQGSSRART